MLINSPNISGSLTVTGNSVITGSLTVLGGINGAITGSATTASYVEYSNVADKPTLVSGSGQISFNGITDKPTLVSGSEQITYSGLTGIPSGILSGSAQIADFGIFATTGSNQFNGNQAITGSLTTTGTIVAQTLNVQQVTSSVVYSSGSNIFGNSISNTQQFTGSINLSGSFIVGDPSNGLGRIFFDRTSNNTRIESAKDGTDSVGLSFRTQASGGGFAERMVISGSNVGLGTSNPLTDLSIYPTNSSIIGTGIRISRNTLENQQFVDINYSGGSANFTAVDTINGAGGFTFNRSGVANDTGYSSSMEITTAGKVGIGVTPISTLSVSTTSDTTDLGSTGLTIGGSTILTSGNVLMLNFTPIGAGSNRARAGIGCEVGADWGKGNLTFYTKDSSGGAAMTTADERMRITSAGNVVIGTTSAYGKLSVLGDDSTVLSSFRIGSSGTTGVVATVYNINQTVDSFAGIQLITRGSGASHWGIFNKSVGAENGTLVFGHGTGGTGYERMVITSGGDQINYGNIFLNQTAVGTVNANATSIGINGIYYMNRGSGAGLSHVIFSNGGNVVGSITSNTTNTQFNTSSDYRLKQDLKDFNALDILSNIKLYDFAWKLNNSRMYGVLAHELKELIPYTVVGEKDEIDENGNIKPQGVDYSLITPILAKAIQELKAENDTLKSRIDTLEQA